MNPWFFSLKSAQSYNPAETGSTPAAFGRYRRDFFVSYIAAIVTLFAAVSSSGAPYWVHTAAWLLYMAALCSIPVALIRYCARWDELQQRIFVSTAANTFVFTVLELMVNTVLPKIGVATMSPLVQLLIPLIFFAIWHQIARRRYS